MISGTVNSQREAVVPVSLLDTGGALQPIDAVLDTGFTGKLTLPSKLIDDLGLEFFDSRSAVLGDGSETLMETYRGDVMWHGRARRVIVLESEGGPLLGMELLEGSTLLLRVEPEGVVQIEEIGKQ